MEGREKNIQREVQVSSGRRASLLCSASSLFCRVQLHLQRKFKRRSRCSTSTAGSHWNSSSGLSVFNSELLNSTLTSGPLFNKLLLFHSLRTSSHLCLHSDSGLTCHRSYAALDLTDSRERNRKQQFPIIQSVSQEAAGWPMKTAHRLVDQQKHSQEVSLKSCVRTSRGHSAWEAPPPCDVTLKCQDRRVWLYAKYHH